MMGPTHALSAAGVFLAVSFPISHYVHHLGPLPAAVGTIVAAGAGLLPDLDHPSASPARAFGPISQTAARIVCAVSGGHRHATHSLVGLAVFTAGAVAASFNVWALTVLIWLCMGLGVRALWRRPPNRPNGRLDYRDVAGLVHAAVAFFIAFRLTHAGIDLWVVPVAVGVGYFVHLAGDSMTESGVNWLWPDRRRFRIASIDTGKSVERWVVVPALYVGIAAVVYVTHGTWVPALLHTIKPE
ncbi:metal-dependent hydrolase [Actinoallomurus purpureus]|uniref:metal-dependent hydrolase n=1 Tax=Actinoallomurus purpureus TaxID=478114 RepID=UPI002092901B|nr:metal-dependent hydrolase [Actinoallomurus purpureus]MCO6011547.1 metal-dependent hydrolase [Actinoallomurus purpureus]